MQPPSFDDKGLVPCIVQDASTGTVLMLAWMNEEAHRLTLETEVVHFWSRSRKALWKKGETSGNFLHLVELRIDCDRDAVLVRARPDGPTCHTGTTACFFHAEHPDPHDDDGVPAQTFAAGDVRVLEALAATIAARKHSTAEKSYTRSLLDGGAEKINGKILEEAGELCAELSSGPPDKIAHEAADLIFHILVGLAARDVPLAEVWTTLQKRVGTSGHVEKAARGTPA